MAGGFPLGTRVELDLDEWVDVTSRVLARDPISIVRGRSADASSTDPASCRFTLRNHDDAFSMRNPFGPYFGKLRRNTPVRVSLPADVTGLQLRYNAVLLSRESGAFTPGVGLPSTGDLDLRVEIDADQWERGQLLGKYQDLDGERAWMLLVEGGALTLFWSPDGLFLPASQHFVTSKPIFGDRGPAHRAVRAVLSVADGSVTFYVAPTLAGPWTVADTVAGAGATSIVAGDAGLEAGAIFAFNGQALPGIMIGAEVRRGGALVASPDFSAQTVGDTSFPDAQGNTWTLGTDAEITDRDVRFYGEVSQWPQSRDVAEADKTVQVTAYGIRRRLTLNAPTLDSAMVREFASPERTAIVAYWAMEEAAGATKVASAFPGYPAMNVYGTPEFAVYPDWPSSKPLPKMRTGAFVGSIPAYDFSAGVIQLRWFMDMDTPPAAETNLIFLRTSTMVWNLTTDQNGAIRVRAMSTDEEKTYADSGYTQFHMDQKGFSSVNFLLEQLGSDIHWVIEPLDFQNDETWNTPIPATSFEGTLAGKSVGRATAVTVARDYKLGDVAIGHLAVANTRGAYAATGGALNTWNGESAEERVSRLSREDGITVRVNDGGGFDGYLNAHRLGKQTADTWLALLEEAETADLGLLTEPRDELGFVYRSRWGLTNQPVRLALDYDTGEIAGTLQPVDDDNALTNDITVSRPDGGSARAEDEESPLSVFSPPVGVGRYSDQVDISAQADEWLPSQAAFRLRLGTVDAARYPTLAVDLHAPRVSDDQARRVRRLDIGDRIDLLHADAWTPVTPLIVTGYQEDLQVATHRFTYNVTPGDPWTAGVVDSGADRYDTAGSELATPPPPVRTAPAFVAKAETYWNATDIPVTLPSGGDLFVACISWATTAEFTRVPVGWTLRKRLTSSAANAAVYTAPGTVTDSLWQFAAVTKTAAVVLGYTAGADVTAIESQLEAASTVTHTAPAVVVPAGPATLVRFYWDRSTLPTVDPFTPWVKNDAAATVRGFQHGMGGGTASVLATDQAVSAGTIAAATATAPVASAQAGGFSLVLYETTVPADPGGGDGGVSETDTALGVATLLGPLWTTAPAELPLDVMCGGERMTVTAITGTASPQTFTVVRGVNGVQKAHDAGTDVRLADPAYSSL